MKFGVEKCAVLVLNRSKQVQSGGIILPYDSTTRAMEECEGNEGYKYLAAIPAKSSWDA